MSTPLAKVLSSYNPSAPRFLGTDICEEGVPKFWDTYKQNKVP